MGDEEIYATCVCGALISEKNMNQHSRSCLKDFLKNSVTLKISSNSPEGHPRNVKTKERHGFAECMRCGYAMTKHEGTLITFYPSAHKSSVTCCSYRHKSRKCNGTKAPACKTCKLPNEFHQDVSDEIEAFDCIVGDAGNDKTSNGTNKGTKCRERKAVVSEFLEGGVSGADADDAGNNVPEHEHSLILDEIPSGPPCRQFHVAVMPNYNNTECSEDSMYQNYALLLQILDSSPPKASAGTRTDLVTSEDVGVQVRILGVYPEEVEKLLAEADKDGLYSLPPFDPAAEAAFQSHLATLIPCPHCSRTFSPDRIQKHSSCCIDRPRTRECVTPEGGEIKR